MKQIMQSYRSGELSILDVPVPQCGDNGILIKTTASLLSSGTEKMIVNIAKKSLVGKALARPDLVRQTVLKMKQEGIKNTIEKVFNKLDVPISLGYSCSGRIIDVGGGVSGVSVGDRVACAGVGYACHGEVNFIPKNLFVHVPENVDDIDASFVAVGAIALQGVRQAAPMIGEKVVVIGLGLIGQLTVQILKANGCKVLGTDIDVKKLNLAKELGADEVCLEENLSSAALEFSCGIGADCVLITASTTSNRPIENAGEVVRRRGKVIVVGSVGMDIPRDIYYKKELDLKLSMSYGPGRYDANYEEKGIDYPLSYVRWTEHRNFELFLELISLGKVIPKKLITHRFSFDEALKAYDLFDEKSKEPYLGIVFTYKNDDTIVFKKEVPIISQIRKANEINIGLIGAGNFVRSSLLPNLKRVGGINFVGVCARSGLSAHTIGQKYGFKFETTDVMDILNNESINAVVIATRHDSHGDYVLKGLNFKKHVYVEKPLCIQEEQIEKIKSLYESFQTSSPANPLLMIGFNRRFSPLIIQMQEIVKNMPINIVYRINAGIIPKESWIQDREIGGGRIIGEMCHFIDTCTFLTGSSPLTVQAVCVRKEDQSIPDEDNVSVLLTFGNGSTATINYTAFGNKNMSKENIEVFAHNISMEMKDFRELTIYQGNKTKKFRNINQDKGIETEIKMFKDAIIKGTTLIPFDSICTTTKVTFAIIKSLRLGEIVKL